MKEEKRIKANILFPKKPEEKKGKATRKITGSFAEIRKCGLLQITALIKTQNAME